MEYKYMTRWKTAMNIDAVMVYVLRYGWPSDKSLGECDTADISQEILHEGRWERFGNGYELEPTISITGQEIARGGIAAVASTAREDGAQR